MPAAAANRTPPFPTRQTSQLRRRLASQVRRALRTSDAQAVHQVRVAIRRFRQALAIWKPCFPAKQLRKTRRSLKRIMSAAGEVRNYDVTHKLLLRWRLPRHERLRAKLETRREDAMRLLAARLKRWTNPVLVPQDSVPELAHRAIDRLSREFLERGREAASPKASPQVMHRFRIVVKKYRYTLELLLPASPMMPRIQRVSAQLGDINDCEAAAEIVPALASHLKKRQRRKIEAFRQLWAAEFEAPRKKPAAASPAFRRRSAA